MRGIGVCASVHALPAAVEIVETVVLLVNDNDVLDFAELAVARAVVYIRSGGRRQRLRAARSCQGSPEDDESNCSVQELNAVHNYLLNLISGKRVRIEPRAKNRGKQRQRSQTGRRGR